METKVDALVDEKVPAAAAVRGWRRALLPMALLLGLSLADFGGRAATNSGIDPLDVLDLTVKNNILFVLDTSGSMSAPPDSDWNGQEFGTTDDPTSRSYQAKDAIKQVVASQNGKVNFGLATFNILNTDKRLVKTMDVAYDTANPPNTTTVVSPPLLYVTADANGADWVKFFDASDPYPVHTSSNKPLPTGWSQYDGNTSADIFNSFSWGPGIPHNSSPAPNGTDTLTGYPAGCSTASGQLSPIDLSTPSATRCRFYVRSRLYRNATQIKWDRAASPKSGGMTTFTSFACPLAPAGLLPFNKDNNGDGFADNPVPCFQLVDKASGRTATYFYSGANFENFTGDACGGASLLSAVSPCDDPTGAANTAVINAINKAMNVAVPPDANGKLNLKASGTGSGAGVMEVTSSSTYPLDQATFQVNGMTPPDQGVSTTQSTPIGRAISDVRTATNTHPAGGTGMFPPRPAAAVGLQKNFVIVVTDGDDTCEGAGNDDNAITAAKKAQDLFYNTKPGTVPTNWNAEPTDPQHQATTFVVAFGTGIAPARANVIAQGGSGAEIDTGGCGSSGGCNKTPATAYTCPAGASCRDAFLASNTAQLVDALNQAIALAAGTGTFAASPGVVDDVFEYVKYVAPGTSFDPLDPNTRFKATAPVLVQPTFDLPGFKGHLTAFMNKNGLTGCPAPANEPVPGTCQLWDAGQKLYDRITKTPAGAACTSGSTNCMVPAGEYNFASLMGSATLATAGTATDLRIRRRIFTTGDNGVNPVNMPLWPPTTGGNDTTCATDAACQTAGNGVAPRSSGGSANNANPLGSLDVALGIANMSFGQLQTEYLACTGTPLPAACTDNTGTNKLRRAKLEAREIILAATAGADPVLLSGALKRDSNGWPLFKAKSWMLAESSYASPAIVTRSPDKPTDNEKQEWILYRDGPRQSSDGSAVDAISSGYGNRNPDKDNTAASKANINLKPAMTFVLYPANDMLHAFRAGPCPVVSPAPPCSGELGGEEMWGFVPFDQLGKLASARKVQSRSTKVYMMASSVRFGDVFIRSAANFTIQGISYKGKWRKVAYVGRGLGGKYYSGLDLTLTGPFTAHSLTTAVPTVLFNRGNPDTDDGLLKSASNNYASDNTTGAPVDYAAYLGMGESWSTPAMARVDPAFNGTARSPIGGTNGGVQFALYMGSGFSDTLGEGTTFYGVDALTGDVINDNSPLAPNALNIGDDALAASGVPATLNALVADAAAFAPNLLVAGSKLPNPANELATRVFIGDIHGRLWKFRTDDPGFASTSITTPFATLGPDQPIGVAVGLLNYDSDGSGGVKPHIYVVGGGDRRVTVPPAFKMFGFREESGGNAFALPGFPIDLPPTPDPGYRGTLQPTTAFNDQQLGRVFFTGTRFNPPGANCVSTFSSIIFAVTAGTGAAAYDLSNGGDDKFIEIKGKVISPPDTSTGQPEIVTGDRITAPPAPPPPAKQTGGLGAATSVSGLAGPAGSPLYRMVSSVCN